MPIKEPWWSLVKRTVTLRPVEDLSIHISIKYTPKTSTNCLLHSVLLLELVRANKMCMYHFKLGKSLEFSSSNITIEFFQGLVRQRCNVRSMFLNTLKYWTVYIITWSSYSFEHLNLLWIFILSLFCITKKYFNKAI